MKINTPTPHNSANYGDIAKTVLMPGDPLRCKYIAEKYLENPVCYNKVRGMFGYTGTYKGVEISIQGSGMGIPSMAIYSTELFEAYNVDNIIRIGSAGALAEGVNLRDIVVAKEVDTDSNYLTNKMFDKISPVASEVLLSKLKEVVAAENKSVKIGKIFTSDIFYNDMGELIELANKGILAVEMETLALYTNAIKANKNALSILTISDRPLKGESLSSEDREKSFDEMMKIALEIAIKC